MTTCGSFHPAHSVILYSLYWFHSHLLTAEQEYRAEQLPKMMISTHSSIKRSSQTSCALLLLYSGTDPVYECRKLKLTCPFLSQWVLPWGSSTPDANREDGGLGTLLEHRAGMTRLRAGSYPSLGKKVARALP